MESARLKVAGIAFTAVLAAVGLAAVIGGIGYGAYGEEGRIGPGFLPVLAGGLTAAFAILDIIGCLRRRPGTHGAVDLALDTESIHALESEAELEAEVASDVDIFGRTQKQRNRMLVAVLGILIATIILVGVIGFILAFALMLVACAALVERRRLLPSLIVAAVALGAAYLIFGVLLRVPLPQGLLGIFLP